MMDSGLSSEEERMMVESDEDLLNEETPVSEPKTTDTKKHKRSYDPRYAVPTFEERQMMRDADMDVEVSMLELEESGEDLMSYIKKTYHYRADRVGRALSTLGAEEETL